MTNGKGDTQRPASVERETFAANWQRTFGVKKRDTCETQDPDATCHSGQVTAQVTET